MYTHMHPCTRTCMRTPMYTHTHLNPTCAWQCADTRNGTRLHARARIVPERPPAFAADTGSMRPTAQRFKSRCVCWRLARSAQVLVGDVLFREWLVMFDLSVPEARPHPLDPCIMNPCIALSLTPPPPPVQARRQVPVLGLARQNKDYVPAQLPGVDETSLPGLLRSCFKHALARPYVGARSRLHTHKQTHTRCTHAHTHACTHARTHARTHGTDALMHAHITGSSHANEDAQGAKGVETIGRSKLTSRLSTYRHTNARARAFMF